MWEYNYDCLEHHGILGQKWGVRRFQNADGSLTAAGKKRYGLNQTQSEELLDLEKQNSAKFRKTVLSNKAVKTFIRDNAKEVNKAYWNMGDINADANRYAVKETGGTFLDYMTSGNDAKIGAYMAAGRKYVEENKDKYYENYKKFVEASAQYEKKANEFINDLYGEYAKAESKNDRSIAFQDGKIRKQTLGERAAFTIYQKGNPDWELADYLKVAVSEYDKEKKAEKRR